VIRTRRAAFAAAALAAATCLAGLGVWQLERRAWKHELIAAVDARTHAASVAAPGPASWPQIDAGTDAYRRVNAIGRFDHDRETLVQAVTERGAGYWVLTPLVTKDFTVLVNRGFVPVDKRDPKSRAPYPGTAAVTGLLRMSEPGGAFLRSNNVAAGRWYSRDVMAIARARRLGQVAPYFIDADNSPNPGGYPVGGLTVVRFNDHHMVYALTWFGLCALSLFFAWRLWHMREE